MAKCRNCGQQLRDGAKFCGSCGKKVIYPAETKERELTKAEVPVLDFGNWLPLERVQIPTINQRDIWLENLLTHEKVEIDRFPFTMGKSQETCYSIPENKGISRKHAQIEKRNGEYFLVDLGSLNHTYVERNGQHEMIEQACLLQDGTVFYLANMPFAIEIR